MRRASVAVSALAVVLGGCVASEEAAAPPPVQPQFTASSASPEPAAVNRRGCSLLTAKERRSTLGAELEVAPSQVGTATLDCRWVDTLTAPASTTLRVEATPARLWVQELPQQIDGMIAAGRGESDVKRLLAVRKKVLERGAEIGDEEACRIFSLLVEADGGGRGKNQSAFVLQADLASVTAAAHSCRNGVYTLVAYDEEGLTPSAPLTDAVFLLVKFAQKRAAAIL